MSGSQKIQIVTKELDIHNSHFHTVLESRPIREQAALYSEMLACAFVEGLCVQLMWGTVAVSCLFVQVVRKGGIVMVFSEAGINSNYQHTQRRSGHLRLGPIVLAVCLHSALGQSPLRLVPSPSDGDGLRPFCKANVGWAYGRLLGYDYNRSAQPVICVHDWNGNGERIPFGIPSAARISLAWAAMAPDGGIALVGSAYMEDGTAGTFVARVSADRKEQSVTRVWPYCPIQAVVASDGVLWTVGWVLNEEDDFTAKNVLRRFDRFGKVLSTAPIRVSRSKRESRGEAVEGSLLSASKDRVAWLTNGNEYFEFGMDGRELFREDGPPAASAAGSSQQGLALSQGGIAIVGTRVDVGMNVARLDRPSRTWITMQTPAPALTWGRLMGFEEDDIVFENDTHILHRYRVEPQ